MGDDNDKLGQLAQIIKILTWQKTVMLISLFAVFTFAPVIADGYSAGWKKTEAVGHVGSGFGLLGIGAYVTKKILG